MTPRPTRPRLTAHREAIVPTMSEPPAPASPPPQIPTPTTTVSLRVPADIAERFRQEMRRLHFEHGASKGDIAAALLTEALSRIDAVAARLPVKQQLHTSTPANN